jgi:hypothetical protein
VSEEAPNAHQRVLTPLQTIRRVLNEQTERLGFREHPLDAFGRLLGDQFFVHRKILVISKVASTGCVTGKPCNQQMA